MNNPVRWLVFAIIVAAVVAGLYAWQRSREAPLPPVAREETPPAPVPKPAPQIRFPLPQIGETPSLPSLEQSDSAMREQMASVFGPKGFEEFFHPKDVIHRIVATIDSLPREKMAARLVPVKTVAGPFLADGAEGNRILGERNSVRYLPYVRMAESVDATKLVAVYVRHYPLFQQAYTDLGYPTGYFNDRLVQVIDHLLAAPDIEGPVKLVQRKVLYEFADPELEARSAGQKILIRVGAANAARLKAKLREIRREVTGQLPKS